ncbi:hypothetical protein Taro_025776 [Colocasia esculenta]|uniref:Uncharacterized protein n=1 Tax=Colocasia esculenta TaxID=4460 RepID=A0A843VPA8_COLES|nr:hypothetical protein [Colocasia esculenta]
MAIGSCVRLGARTPPQNRHSETIDRMLVSLNSVRGPKFHRGACVLVHRLSYPLGFSRSNDSLDHVNPGRGNHTASACHGNRKLCSTRRENSSPGRRYGCTNIADIDTPSGLFSPLPRKNWP